MGRTGTMSEPGFYQCLKCGHRWSRMEFKMRPNPPAQCPKGCNAKPSGDPHAEDAYMNAVYRPLADLIIKKPEKK